ncbi:acyl-CoA dehydrogenase family protein [Solibacillus sp.]|uniref:acyl-CoA dehydrogenase family protein n=1 Tax=Solibacillus sp. TaxID=1909654 RepID=UPI003315A27B
MDFSLSQEQEMFREYVRKYLNDMEQTKVARDYIDNKVDQVKKVITELNELGCTQLNIPEQYGGMGLGKLDLVPIMEEMGRSLLPGLHLETSAFALPIIERFGTSEQKEKYLSQIAAGEASFTIAWLEPGRSYKQQGVQMQALISGEQLVLNGTKTQVPDIELAHYLLVPVLVNHEVTIAIIDKNTPGITLRAQHGFDETRKLVEVTFEQVHIDQSQIIGPIGDGWSILQVGLLSYNAALSSVMVGAIEHIVETATNYAIIREQFGNPIGRFQAIKHRLADMKLDLETARSLSYYANWALETASEDQVEAIYSARIFTTQAFIRLSAHNIQIHGGIGFTEEIDCHLFVKRARFYENYLGNLEDCYDYAIGSLGWAVPKKETILNV